MQHATYRGSIAPRRLEVLRGPWPLAPQASAGKNGEEGGKRREEAGRGERGEGGRRERGEGSNWGEEEQEGGRMKDEGGANQ